MLERLREVRNRARSDAALRALHDSCRTLMSERGEANSVKFARTAIEQFRGLGKSARATFFSLLANDFAPDPAKVVEHAQRYAQSRSAEALNALLHAVEPPRQELLRRLNRAPNGTAMILEMRRDLLAALKMAPELAAVDADFHHLLSSWFNPGFLRLVRVDWSSPAKLLEQLIRHEAVHEIQGWDDLRRRLDPDRRCFAFFHPALPEDPLIFVEVALTNDMPDAIAPLLNGPVVDPEETRARVAAFYSISNCQPGLRGVSLGNFLIKQVCEILKEEFPRLNRFCTLSPMPGFAAWLQKEAPLDKAKLPNGAVTRIAQARKTLAPLLAESAANLPAALERATPPMRAALLRLAAAYLCSTNDTDPLADPVAKFHLHNGAQLARLNFGANKSPRGLRESFAIMVNYVYELRDIEKNHEAFIRGKVAAGREVVGLI